MICPRCSVAEISLETHRCVLCGYVPVTGVAVQAPASDEVQETLQRELAGRFALQVLLRRERKSTLYVARDLEDDKLVTLRLIPQLGPVDGDLIHRFAQAGTLATRLRHPHVVPVLKQGVTHSLLWYSMEAVKGRTLEMVLRDSGPMSSEDCQKLLEQVGSGLEYLHRNGVIHGGVNPATVLVDAEGWARVTDVGTMAAIFRATGPGTDWEGLIYPAFLAPELIERRLVGPATDQYSLATLAFECLTGLPPAPGETVEEVQRARATGKSVGALLPEFPTHVATAIARATRDDPGERFGSVLDFVAVLSGAFVRPAGGMMAPSNRPAGAPVVVVPDGSRPRRRLRILLALVVAVVIVGATAVALSLLRRPASPEWAVAPPTEAPAPSPTTNDSVRSGDPTELGPLITGPPTSVAPTAAAVPSVPAEASPLPVPTATLFVNARPWGAVYLDGELLGNTPRANVTIPAGVHILRVVRDGFVPFEREIRAEPRATLRITDIVLRPLQP